MSGVKQARPVLLGDAEGHHQVVEDGFGEEDLGNLEGTAKAHPRDGAHGKTARMLRPMNSTVPPPGGR